MSAILSNLGDETGYERVMGLTGVAFILQVQTDGPVRPDGSLDCAWWPNDAWGFALGLPVLTQATGWEYERVAVPVDYQAFRDDPPGIFRRVLQPVIERSLARGRPALAEADSAFVITRLDGGDPPALGYGPKGMHVHALRAGGATDPRLSLGRRVCPDPQT